MAITPDKVLDVTEDEQKRLKLIEERIDKLLVKEFRSGKSVRYPISSRWRPGFVTAIVRRYEEAGWKVSQQSVEAKNQSFLVFENKADVAVKGQTP